MGGSLPHLSLYFPSVGSFTCCHHMHQVPISHPDSILEVCPEVGADMSAQCCGACTKARGWADCTCMKAPTWLSISQMPVSRGLSLPKPFPVAWYISHSKSEFLLNIGCCFSGLHFVLLKTFHLSYWFLLRSSERD